VRSGRGAITYGWPRQRDRESTPTGQGGLLGGTWNCIPLQHNNVGSHAEVTASAVVASLERYGAVGLECDAALPREDLVTRVDDVLCAHAEGRAAAVGAANPYVGRRVLATVWLHGYMLRDMLDASPARQAYLRAQRRNQLPLRRRGGAGPGAR
jgi:hypothetical protein